MKNISKLTDTTKYNGINNSNNRNNEVDNDDKVGIPQQQSSGRRLIDLHSSIIQKLSVRVVQEQLQPRRGVAPHPIVIEAPFWSRPMSSFVNSLQINRLNIDDSGGNSTETRLITKRSVKKPPNTPNYNDRRFNYRTTAAATLVATSTTTSSGSFNSLPRIINHRPTYLTTTPKRITKTALIDPISKRVNFTKSLLVKDQFEKMKGLLSTTPGRAARNRFLIDPDDDESSFNTLSSISLISSTNGIGKSAAGGNCLVFDAARRFEERLASERPISSGDERVDKEFDSFNDLYFGIDEQLKEIGQVNKSVYWYIIK